MSRELRGPLRALLDDPVDDEAVARVGARLRARHAAPRRAPWKPALALVAVTLLGVLAWWAWPAPAPSAIRLASGGELETLRAEEAARSFALDDGSVLELSASASVEVVVNEGTRVVLSQGEGRVTYEIRPGGPRRWIVEAGRVSVEVVGTRFTVERMPDRVRVGVERGRVRVHGEGVPARGVHLDAGQSVDALVAMAEAALPAPEPVPTAVVSETTSTEPEEAEVEDAPAPRSLPTEPTARSREITRWRALARDGDYDAAYAELGSEGLARATAQARSMDDLIALSDTARLSGHAPDAVAPLERAMGLGESRSAVAAVTLGRLQLDALGDPRAGIVALERAFELGVPPHLEETALARLVEAYRRAGEQIRMREAGQRYLQTFPEGRNAARIRGWLGD